MADSRLERVLIVEDDADSLEALTEVLRVEGVPVVEGVRSSAEAESLLSGGFRPSAVVLDLHLRQDRGESLAVRLRADPDYASVPIIAFSGDHAELRRISRLVSRVILKPSSPEILLAALRELCAA